MLGLVDHLWRWRAQRQPFQPAWRTILDAEVPFYGRLAPQPRARFEDKLKVFLLTKHFIEAGGMVLTELHKVVISAAAARLTMNIPGEHYERLTEVVVYPGAYVHKAGTHDGAVFGEAHTWGTVVLSYDAVTHGLKNAGDGHNTAMHEFAHVLDVEDGTFDGTPHLEGRAYAPWASVMSAAFLELRNKDAQRRRSVMRAYGATNEAEFFAVATETFFEKPAQLKGRHPEMYLLLCEYFRMDPLTEV